MNTGTAHKRNTQQRAQLGRKIRTSQLGEERGGGLPAVCWSLEQWSRAPVGGAPQPGGGVESMDWRWSSGRDLATCSQLLLGAQ
jgi:hypothetical protein